MFIYCICTQYLVGAPFALITASIRRGMEVISLWHCWGGMEDHGSLTVAFRSSALLGLVGSGTWQPKSSLTVGTSHWTSSNMDSVPLHSSSRLWDLDFQMKCKIYFHLKRGLWTTELFFSTAQVRRFWCCLWFRSGLVALFLKTSERGDSWCTDSSFSQLLVKLSQVFESALLDSILKLAVIPVACAPFPTQILPSSQLCI